MSKPDLLVSKPQSGFLQQLPTNSKGISNP
jgi:hypothetical protein